MPLHGELDAKESTLAAEFVALKFALDEFAPYIYGAPIEIETDCQALRNLLLREKPRAIHMCWAESILAHNIVNIQHRPGVTNHAANPLSRKW